MSSPAKTWNPTRYKHLYRHASGIYYARLTVNGKKTWRSLRTKKQGVAQAQLAQLLQGNRMRAELASPTNGSLPSKLGELASLHLTETQNSASTKPSTKKYQREVHESLFITDQDLPKRPIDKITEAECQSWARAHRGHFSPTRFNAALGAMKQMFALAIEQGLRLTNPAAKIKRAKIVQKDLGLKLPQPKVFAKWVSNIRSCPSAKAEEAGDFVEFLAYSGMRPDTEAAHVQWRHCDFEAGELVVTGDPTEGTKNYQSRRVPMNASLRELLERIKDCRSNASSNNLVLQIGCARRAMKAAALRIGMEPITPYDLRHLFTTRCIESGVDIPTVAKWLGHRDRGALLMRTYNHVRDAHSREAAKKVNF